MLCFTVKRMTLINNEWEKGNKKLVAYKGSPLFSLLDKFRFIDQIEDFKEDVNWMNNLICVDGKWFDYKGNIIDKSASDKSSSTIYIESCDYEPKGKIKYIYDIVENSYDYLWMMAIIDFMKGNMNSTYLNYDNIACMMIANAWEILSEFEQIKEIENILVNCIEYLIKESNEYMSNKLSWSSPKDLIYNTIKSYPMTGIFEDTVNLLLEKAPYRILRPWIRVDNIKELIMYSLEFSNSSLYAIHIEKANSYIEINPNWKSYLHNENDNSRTYLKCKYLEFVTSTL